MPIVRPTPYYGSARPCSMYRNGVKLAGYKPFSLTGTDMTFERTYNDRVDVVAQGRSKQAVTVQGANIFDINRFVALAGNAAYYGKTTSGKLRQVAPDYRILTNVPDFAVLPAGTYRVSANHANYYLAIGSNTYTSVFTLATATAIKIKTWAPAGTEIEVQIVAGSTAVPWTPFVPNSPSPEYPSPVISSAGSVRAQDQAGTRFSDMAIPELRAIPDGAGGWIARDEEYIARVGEEWHRFKVQRAGRKVFDGTEVWTATGTYPSGKYRMSCTLTGAKPAPTDTTKGALVCTRYRTLTATDTYLQMVGASIESVSATLRVYDSNYTGNDLTGWKAQLAKWYADGDPLYVDYQLATPIETDLGPIDLPSYYPYTRVLVSGDYPPDVTATCKVVDGA